MKKKFDTIDSIEEYLQVTLNKKRFRHTLSVAYTAASLAMCHGVDVQKAYLAGLLHDNAKCYDNAQKIALCHEYELTITKTEALNPELLHAKLGSFLAKEKFGVADKEIMAAIKYHTTGRPKMSKLEMIIFIADYIEPNRKMIRGLNDVRKIAFTDLNKALVMILKNSLDYLAAKDEEIDDLTRKTYKYYKEL